MDGKEFAEICDEQVGICLRLLGVKADEYATDIDRLHNFKTAGHLKGETPIQALAGMMAKHTVSIYDMALSEDTHPIALWTEKITDHINYLLLLKALVIEEVYPIQNYETRKELP